MGTKSAAMAFSSVFFLSIQIIYPPPAIEEGPCRGLTENSPAILKNY